MVLLNLIFSFLAVFHLTYLGSMFDPGVDEQEVEEVRGPDLTASVQEVFDQSVVMLNLVLFVSLVCRGIRPSTPSTGGPS